MGNDEKILIFRNVVFIVLIYTPNSLYKHLATSWQVMHNELTKKGNTYMKFNYYNYIYSDKKYLKQRECLIT